LYPNKHFNSIKSKCKKNYYQNIKKIIPKNYKWSNIELKNGETILIGEMQDVSDRNDGVLVFENKEDPVYFPWDKIEEIHFK